MPTYPSEFLYVNLEPRVPLSGTRAEVIFLLLVLPGHWTTLLLSDVLTNLAWDGLAGLLGNLPTLLYWLKSTLKRNVSNRRFRNQKCCSSNCEENSLDTIQYIFYF